MRKINVWAYHRDFGTLCRYAGLDKSTGFSYPQGNQQGQAGWHVTIPFDNLNDLARKLSAGVPMPKEFCGNWLQDCDPIQRGEIARLALNAHGDQGGVWAANGKNARLVKAENLAEYHDALHTIGLYTSEDATVLLMGCLSAQGVEGTKLLSALSRIWTHRLVVGFTTLGYRHPGAMKRAGEACELPGMRDTDAPAELYANPPKFDALWADFQKMPWASESSTHAKIVQDATVRLCPKDELCAAPAPKKVPPPLKKFAPGGRR